jgi:hypothetical protein
MTPSAQQPAPDGRTESSSESVVAHGAGADARSARGRVPDFFIVGHPKSGTTALYETLRRHPQIYMSDVKEPRYFSSDLPSRYKPWKSGTPAATYDDYLALFNGASPDQRVGEASTSYIWSQVAAERIAAAQPDARIVAILREPTSYLRSMHLQLLQIRTEKEADLRKAIALEPARREGRDLPGDAARWPQVLLYTDRVRYAEQLRRFHAVFSAEQVLVLIYDDFRDDNDATVRRVQRFLGVDDSGPLEVAEANPSVRMRSVALDEIVHAVNVGRGPVSRVLKTAIRTVVPRQLRHDAHRAVQRRLVFGSPQPPDEDLMLELRRRFRGEVEAVSEYLQRDLVALWGYDDLGPAA